MPLTGGMNLSSMLNPVSHLKSKHMMPAPDTFSQKKIHQSLKRDRGTNAILHDSIQTSVFNLMDWLITEYAFTPQDAYCLVSTCPDFRINVYQMVKVEKLNHVTGAELPVKYIKYT